MPLQWAGQSRVELPGSANAQPPALRPRLPPAPTVITVTAAKETGVPADVDADQAAKTADQSKAGTSSTSSVVSRQSPAVSEVAGVEKSAIYRIRPRRCERNRPHLERR